MWLTLNTILSGTQLHEPSDINKCRGAHMQRRGRVASCTWSICLEHELCTCAHQLLEFTASLSFPWRKRTRFLFLYLTVWPRAITSSFFLFVRAPSSHQQHHNSPLPPPWVPPKQPPLVLLIHYCTSWPSLKDPIQPVSGVYSWVEHNYMNFPQGLAFVDVTDHTTFSRNTSN